MLLPEPPEGGKMELVRGEVVCMAPVGGEHGKRALRLGARILAFAGEHQLGEAGAEIGYRLRKDPDVVRAPDVSFLAASRLKDGRFPQGYVDGPPTLAVEVVSPGDRDGDVSTKVEDYLAAGTARVWVVRPEQRTITVYRSNGDAHIFREGETLGSDDAAFEVDGFALDVRDVFA